MVNNCFNCQTMIFHRPTFFELFFKNEQHELICDDCFKTAPFIDQGSICKICGRPFQKDICQECLLWQRNKPFLANNRSLLRYDRFTKEYMRHYKFNGDYRYKDIFREDLKKIFFSRIKRADFFIPIPLSDESQMNRGFNQVTGLFSFAEKYIRNDFLILKGEKTQSSKLGRRQRMAKNNPFVCLKSLPENPHIILADDVYTTGATLHHAADTLKKAGAGIIESITLAR